MIKVIDDFFSEDNANFVINFCRKADYHFGEVDEIGLPPVGFVAEIEKDTPIYKLFTSAIEKECADIIKGLAVGRTYVNCFAPNENPFFHVDGESGYTFLYYVPSGQYQGINDGGETQFFINNQITGILPIPNRLVAFDAFIPHRATSFRGAHRFTLAVKYW